MRQCGPVTQVEETSYGGVRITFTDKSAVCVTQSHWEAIVDYVRGTGEADCGSRPAGTPLQQDRGPAGDCR